MKYILLFVLALMTSTAIAADTQSQNSKPTAADQINQRLAQMTDQQKAAMLEKFDANTAEAASLSEKMAAIGVGIGKSLSATAHELNVAVNEFATSTVGKITIVLIVWNYLGHDILNIVFCLGMVGVMAIVIRSYKRFLGVYDEKGKFVRYNLEALADVKNGSSACTMTAVHIIALVLCMLAILIRFP